MTQRIAPLADVIRQLAIHSVGGVVTSAQPLMIVVPDSATVTAEVTVANTITVEIKTGQRRVIEYLLSPVQRAGSENLRER